MCITESKLTFYIADNFLNACEIYCDSKLQYMKSQQYLLKHYFRPAGFNIIQSVEFGNMTEA